MTHYTAIVRDDKSLELPLELRRLLTPGQRIDIDLESISASNVKPNDAALATLREIAEMTKAMPETDASQTDRLLQEGRAGAMYLLPLSS